MECKHNKIESVLKPIGSEWTYQCRDCGQMFYPADIIDMRVKENLAKEKEIKEVVQVMADIIFSMNDCDYCNMVCEAKQCTISDCPLLPTKIREV